MKTIFHSSVRPLFLASCSGVALLNLFFPPTAVAAPTLQPPILQWSHPPVSAPQPTPPAAEAAPTPVAPTPAVPTALPPAPVKPVPLTPEPPTSVPVASIPITPPPVTNSVSRLFAFQAGAVDPGHFQPIPGAEASKSYRNWLQTFQNQTSGGSGMSGTSPSRIGQAGVGGSLGEYGGQ